MSEELHSKKLPSKKKETRSKRDEKKKNTKEKLILFLRKRNTIRMRIEFGLDTYTKINIKQKKCDLLR